MFTVFTEKDAFEIILGSDDELPNWHDIFCNHADICLNISDEELLISKEVPGTPIFEYLQINGGNDRGLTVLKDYFHTLYEDLSQIAEQPRSAFFLNVSKEKAEELQNAYGVVVQSLESIDDTVLKGTKHVELPKGKILEKEGICGWRCLFSFPLPPSNALVITDDYLFQNEESGKLVGEQNCVSLIDAILPKSLKTTYHILLISKEPNKSKERLEHLAGNLKTDIAALRPYTINFELVFTDTIHKRKLFLNYLSVTCDKGFALFKLSDQKTVRDDNDFRYEKIFNRLYPHEGDSVCQSDLILLKQLKTKCKSVSEYISNRCQDHNHRIFGDCNPNKTIKNRLINYC